MVPLAPLSTLPPALGVLGGATQRGCSGKRLNVGSIHAAEGLGCLPQGPASALQMWHDSWPVVGVRDCPPWSRSQALSLGLGGDTGWGSGLSPRQSPGCAVHQCTYSLSLPDPGGPGLLAALQSPCLLGSWWGTRRATSPWARGTPFLCVWTSFSSGPRGRAREAAGAREASFLPLGLSFQ